MKPASSPLSPSLGPRLPAVLQFIIFIVFVDIYFACVEYIHIVFCLSPIREIQILIVGALHFTF
jgi:hypothetical protein